MGGNGFYMSKGWGGLGLEMGWGRSGDCKRPAAASAALCGHRALRQKPAPWKLAQTSFLPSARSSCLGAQ